MFITMSVYDIKVKDTNGQELTLEKDIIKALQ
jgi:hypothetical protein